MPKFKTPFRAQLTQIREESPILSEKYTDRELEYILLTIMISEYLKVDADHPGSFRTVIESVNQYLVVLDIMQRYEAGDKSVQTMFESIKSWFTGLN